MCIRDSLKGGPPSGSRRTSTPGLQVSTGSISPVSGAWPGSAPRPSGGRGLRVLQMAFPACGISVDPLTVQRGGGVTTAPAPPCGSDCKPPHRLRRYDCGALTQGPRRTGAHDRGRTIRRAGMSAEPRALAWPERLLRPFAEVRAGEAMTALVLTATIFLILTAYYLLKVIREPLILLSGGAEVKAYAAAGQALLLIPVLRAHGAIARRVSRLKLIAIIFLFVASNLLVFAALFRASVPIGLSFYLWVGTFNYLLVATFWSFANDVYTPEQGKRLFAIIGVGSSVGALAGAALASFLLKKLGPLELMLASAALLVVTLVPFALVNGQQRC